MFVFPVEFRPAKVLVSWLLAYLSNFLIFVHRRESEVFFFLRPLLVYGPVRDQVRLLVNQVAMRLLG